MKSIDLYTAVKKEGFTSASLIISDVDYAMPKASWLTGTFYDFYQEWRFDHNLNEWSNKNDCDNAACLFYTFAQICHAKSDRAEQGISVGELFYFIGGDKTRGHAINIAITDKGAIYIEPQSGKTLSLTKTEKESSWFVRF
jgi:hypothetical protein